VICFLSFNLFIYWYHLDPQLQLYLKYCYHICFAMNRSPAHSLKFEDDSLFRSLIVIVAFFFLCDTVSWVVPLVGILPSQGRPHLVGCVKECSKQIRIVQICIDISLSYLQVIKKFWGEIILSYFRELEAFFKELISINFDLVQRFSCLFIIFNQVFLDRKRLD